MPVLLSSNLNVFKNAPAILAEAPDKLMLSVSGWTQGIYERYHRGGNIETVKKNMAEVAALRKRGTQEIRLAGTIIDITNMKLP